MSCEIRDRLREKHRSATLALSAFEESRLMRTQDEILADEEKLEHLEAEYKKTHQELLDHIEEHSCA